MLCIYAIAMDPERKGHLYKVTGKLWKNCGISYKMILIKIILSGTSL